MSLQLHVVMTPTALDSKVQRYDVSVKPGSEKALDDYLSILINKLYSHGKTRKKLKSLIPSSAAKLGFASETEAWAQLDSAFYPKTGSKLERGEFGEALAYALFEDLLEAHIPVKKIRLSKTNSNMAVFGKDVVAFTSDKNGKIRDLYLIEVKTSLSASSLQGNVSGLIDSLDEYGPEKLTKELDLIVTILEMCLMNQDADSVEEILDLLDNWEEVTHCCLIVLDSAATAQKYYGNGNGSKLAPLTVPSPVKGNMFAHIFVLPHDSLKDWASEIYRKGGLRE